jgi:hypothetical protein
MDMMNGGAFLSKGEFSFRRKSGLLALDFQRTITISRKVFTKAGIIK